MRDYDSPPEFYLVSTDHLEESIWFKDDADFSFGMNLTALLHCVLGTGILAFILMSNHVHFLLECSEDDASTFINEFKRRYSIYMRCKYGVKEMLRDNASDIRPVSCGGESVEKTIAYIIMNSVAAGVCLNPGDYPWGSGSAFFKYTPPGLAQKEVIPRRKISGTPASAMSSRKLAALMHSRIPVPGSYVFTEQGFIAPESYINFRFVESVYRTPGRMNYFLRNSSKAKIRLQAEDAGVPVFRDQLVSAAVTDLCQSVFGKSSVNDLPELQKAELLRQLRFRFAANINQLCRVTGIPYDQASRLIDSV